MCENQLQKFERKMLLVKSEIKHVDQSTRMERRLLLDAPEMSRVSIYHQSTVSMHDFCCQKVKHRLSSPSYAR